MVKGHRAAVGTLNPEPLSPEPLTDTILGEFIKRNSKLKRVTIGPNLLTPHLFSL